MNDNLVALARQSADQSLAGALERGEAVETLDLAGCGVTADSAVCVAAYLRYNRSVERVYVGRNSLGSEGLRIVLESLRYNWKVRLLHVSQIYVDETIELVQQLLAHNIVLTEVRMDASNDVEGAATIGYLTRHRNALLIPIAVRSVILLLIGARSQTDDFDTMGILAALPIEIVFLIARFVWKTRRDSEWIRAVSGELHQQRLQDHVQERKALLVKQVRIFHYIPDE